MQLKKIFCLFFLFTGMIYGAYNPFFTDAEPPKPVSRSTALLLPPPMYTHSNSPQEIKLPALSSSPMIYFGFIETEKGKFAMMKVHDHNIVLRENNRVYIGNDLYYIREISSNSVVMEDKEKRIKTTYFSGESDRKK